MPISIPVIEMIEIGAGGGSLAWVDAMARNPDRVRRARGPEPGPACYGRGGTRPAITDADLVLAKLDPDNFAGGAIRLSPDKAGRRDHRRRGGPGLALAPEAAAFGISEVVDENMANAARVHAVENGRDIADTVMIAFGGAAPLHAARLCEKLGIDLCLVPEGAGVGSAIGFLKAPFGYEAVASRLVRLSTFDAEAANRLVADLRGTAEAFVRRGTSAPLHCEITGFIRYAGQGWEIPVTLADRPFVPADGDVIRDAFREAYAHFFGRAIDRARWAGDRDRDLVREGAGRARHNRAAGARPRRRGVPVRRDAGSFSTQRAAPRVPPRSSSAPRCGRASRSSVPR